MANYFFKKMIEGTPCEIVNNKICNAGIYVLKAVNRKTNICFRKIDKFISRYFRKYISKKISIDNNTIMFIAFQGDYTCNPKAISEECIKRKLPYKLYWVVKDGFRADDYPKELDLVKRRSYEFYVAVSKAKVIIDNTHDLPRLGVFKKKDQVLIQTWHGSLGIKRLDGNIVMNKKWSKISEACQRDTDYCISNSDFEDEVFHSSYWPGVPLLKYGHARNDILLGEDKSKIDSVKNKVYDYLHIDKNIKLALYAPTHRDGKSSDIFDIDCERVINALEKRFGGKWCLGIRVHSRQKDTAKAVDRYCFPDVVNATYYPDMQELMLAVDFGITDYSSWIFDYILLNRPAAIIANDIKDFRILRDFYYPIEETPFPIAENNNELIDNIINFDMKSYLIKTEAFLKRLGCIEDGHASERIVDKVIDIMENKL